MEAFLATVHSDIPLGIPQCVTSPLIPDCQLNKNNQAVRSPKPKFNNRGVLCPARSGLAEQTASRRYTCSFCLFSQISSLSGNVNLGVQAKSPTPETNHNSEEMAASSSFQEHRPASSASQPVKKRKPKKKFDIKTLAQADLQSQKGIQGRLTPANRLSANN